MVSLDKLNDKQNMLLTQLSYKSDVLNDNYNGMSLYAISLTIPDESTRQLMVDLCSEGLGSLKIKDVDNDKISGFGAVAFTDEEGNTGFSYRGTDGAPSKESINDWVDNVTTMLTGTSVQTAQAEAFFDKNRDPDGNNYGYGHSKGGELTESVYANNYKMFKGVHLLNPQPLNPYSLTPDQQLAMESKKVDIVIVEGDYVWFLGKLPSYGNVRVVKGNGSNAHLFDAISDMFDENGNLQPGNHPWWEYPAYFLITTLTEKLQWAGAQIGFVYNCVVRVVDFVKNDLIPAAVEFVASVAKALEKMGSMIKDFADNLKTFLGSVIDKAGEWFRNTFDKGYKYANANPQLVVDTNRLRSYAGRLQKVNSRAYNVDRRLDGLYNKVGLLDLWNLMTADLLTGYSSTIRRCADALNQTASDFEQLERTITGKLQ